MNRGRARLAAFVAVTALGSAPSGPAEASAPADPLAALMVSTVPRGLGLVTDGPLTAAQFASYAPDPSAAAAALRTLAASHAFSSEVRAWVDPTARNGIVDLVLALPTSADAQAYVDAQLAQLDADRSARRSSVPGVAHATRYSFLTSVPAHGVEQFVVLNVGRYVATLRFISLIDAQNPTGFSASQAEVTAMSQSMLLSNAADQGDADGSSSVGRLFGVVLGAGAVAVVVALVARRRYLGMRPSVPAGVDLPPPPLDPKLSLPMPAAGTPAGWLPDPDSENGRVRYFDGHAWTQQLRDSP